MATVREGTVPVLLVVDVQAGVMREAWDASRVIKNVSRAVERARDENVPVVWVQHSDEDLPWGSTQWQWVPELVSTQGEPVVHKHFNSSFEQTTLEDELAKLSATHLVLAGAATNWCIRATAYAALDRGYDITLLQDAHTTETMELGDGEKIEAAMVIQELNIAMTWLSYPGRTNGTATVEEVNFGKPGGGE
jgi:nicotinamidase-related amidase